MLCATIAENLRAGACTKKPEYLRNSSKTTVHLPLIAVCENAAAITPSP
jgi:hypothetical protein